MTSTTLLRPWQALSAVAITAAALVVAFVLAPATLASTAATADLGSEGRLIAAFRSAFVGYWRSGNAGFGSPSCSGWSTTGFATTWPRRCSP
jgi:hypothetical protein